MINIINLFQIADFIFDFIKIFKYWDIETKVVYLIEGHPTQSNCNTIEFGIWVW